MTFSVVIPARYAATRLPAKPLLDICGKPMLQHTYERAVASNAEQVLIATDDVRIQEVAEAFGAKVCMTSADHRSGTDRIQEVATQIGMPETQILVNVQADEPLIPPSVINQVAENLEQDQDVGISTLCEKICSSDEVNDPNCVKVVMDKRGYALYFSRATIPWHASSSAKNCYRHIGIYAYRVSILNQFVQWPPSELELLEKLEQLRALDNGITIHVAVSSETIPPGVDTQRDLELVRAHLASQSQ
ncbi:MAG: 3-deoxy-manno-octulosonate cytidylyltransferase [SAR86 cluster bacterium]|uniref:3-deoxy-manno-octulosonate cytidylyltransferase n=1 Tax=SAR86 cluster bacterium TaxID=2030880 RepID=A0A2A5AU84_9GAMM|nr:MAG: 3-deoxy-manno-octulosonate cytidylyltransferase [SAR86 cluster bacterium]